MAEIDVSDILSDDDFQDTFQVVRNAETVDDNGRAQLTPKPSRPIPGVVQPGSGQTLQIMPELARTAGVIEIWTQYNLQGETDTTDPDTVLWNGKHYTVSHTDPWSNWGAGWVHAVCVRKELTDRSNDL